ncbi:MAG: aminotransferase class I/II-fold pyridoxal phosphate-dependent enzyme, partial [Oscillospiraceae bacterium]|nr:aminotransferase class I/II-fold pyridoxal phosphate-dependent enzyme [Oscillospiraceae bacterium]
SECKEIFAKLLGVPTKNVIVCGNSSLNMMFDYITQCMLTGSGAEPWKDQGEIKFLCPCPGYDRHFAICEYYGIKLIPVDMTPDGPDMDAVEELVKDPKVKGMFCVPKYSNPTGVTYSRETVERIAAMTPAATDFRIIWDNAYIIHDLTEKTDKLDNIFEVLKKYDHEDMVIEFTSTSKISFPGAGVAVLAASDRNIDMIISRMSVQTIGYDKLNQFRHVKFYKSVEGIKNHMKLHRNILAPKFKAVINEFRNSLGEYQIATWTEPRGGYFISLDVMPGTAKRVYDLCKKGGVVLTTVGATFPYGHDPKDQNIRIAPSYPPVDELITATKLLCVCVKLAACEKLLSEAE